MFALAKLPGIQIFLLVALLFVRFGYQLFGQAGFVIATYILSFLYFKLIFKENRHLYNLVLPDKKTIIIGCTVAILGLIFNVIIDCFVLGGQFRLISLKLPEHLSHFRLILDIICYIIFLFPSMFIIQFVLNALPEELLFRGFLWGQLRQFKLSDLSICLIQVILFWAAHYFFFDMPWYWLRVLVSGLLFGIVAWKTKSLFISGIVHACMNSADIFVVMP